MIKKLRIKFVCVIMSIVMLMLGIILGVVIHFTAQSMHSKSNANLSTSQRENISFAAFPENALHPHWESESLNPPARQSTLMYVLDIILRRKV